MPELDFLVEGVEVARYAATPLLKFKLRVANAGAEEEIANVMLQCQIQIEAARRRYEPVEQHGLLELFGEPERFGQTVKTMLWLHASVLFPAFQGSCLVDIPVPCSFDFNVVATKYFYALETGEVPLSFQFSGSVFYRGENAALQVSQIAWSKEAGFRLPVAVWQEMMDHYYPNSAWLCLNREVFDRLYRYKMQRGLPTWEQALESLFDAVEEPGAVEESDLVKEKVP